MLLETGGYQCCGGDFAMQDRNDGLQTASEGSRSVGTAVHVPYMRHRRSGRTRCARTQVGEDGARPQERLPNYRVALVRGSLLLSIGAGTWCFGMAIHSAHAHHRVPQARESSIYYCATGLEFPAFEPCKNMKGQRDI
jgi:hypothetical protein